MRALDYGVTVPDAVALLERHGGDLCAGGGRLAELSPGDCKLVSNAISCVLLHLYRMQTGRFCQTCGGKGERTVQRPYPEANGYSPLSTHPCRETCYTCEGTCRPPVRATPEAPATEGSTPKAPSPEGEVSPCQRS